MSASLIIHDTAESEQMCTATTKRGEPCRKRALPGQLYCRTHAPAELTDVSAAEVTLLSNEWDNAQAVIPSEETTFDLPIAPVAVAPEVAVTPIALASEWSVASVHAPLELPMATVASALSIPLANDDWVVRRADPEPAAETRLPNIGWGGNAVEPPPVIEAPAANDEWVRRIGDPEPAAETASSPGAPAFDLEVEVREYASTNPGQTAMVGELAAGMFRMIGENLQQMTPPQIKNAVELLRGINIKDYLDPDFWKGIWMVVEYQVKEQIDFVQRRLRGQYEVDPFGMDRELIDVVRPFTSFMYRTWWRTTTTGLEHVPNQGRTLLLANHGGLIPWDGVMIASSVLEDHPESRVVRNVFLEGFSTLPIVSQAMAAFGQVVGPPEFATDLLQNDELVCVFPEGVRGAGKLFKDRYRLARFGRGGYVESALRTGAPLVPVAVIGSDEIYPMIANVEPLAKVLGLPYFPITPFFPWLGALGAVPLPTHWSITFCEPISTAEYGPDGADDPLVVFMLSEQVREIIQDTVTSKLAERTSVF